MQFLSAAVGAVPQITGKRAPLTKWDELERYLVLGASDGVYYAEEPRLSPDRAPALRECLAE